MNQDGLEFPATFDQEFVLQDRQRGYFGRNVLKGLVDGMEGFLEEKRRTPGFRSMGPVALGGFLWLDDSELTGCLARFAHTCVVVSKPCVPAGSRGWLSTPRGTWEILPTMAAYC
ncbi:hypothetical protein ACPEIC_42160 [Stenotrophomonas sp. NPDC087984]